MKRIACVAISAVVMAACATEVVQAAQPPEYSYTTKTVTLRPSPGSNFPDASGTLSISVAGPIADHRRGTYPSYYYSATFSVHVWGLAPNCQYVVLVSQDGWEYSVTGCITDADGNGSGSNSQRYGSRNDVPRKYYVMDPIGVVELSN